MPDNRLLPMTSDAAPRDWSKNKIIKFIAKSTLWAFRFQYARQYSL
jgi:hypothetical protein